MTAASAAAVQSAANGQAEERNYKPAEKAPQIFLPVTESCDVTRLSLKSPPSSRRVWGGVLPASLLGLSKR